MGHGEPHRPLGNAYPELAAVIAAGEAVSNGCGTWVAAMVEASAGMGWAVRTDDIAAVARQLGLDVAPAARPWLPFFIQWGPDTSLPGAGAVVHGVGASCR
jgi:hypothetical protein